MSLSQEYQGFEMLYKEVRPIMLKLRRQYYIKLWDADDWEQEGRIVLYKLVKKHPELVDNKKQLYIYYKTKFSNYIKDVLRKQESQKRRFDKMPYEEVGEVSHELSTPGLILDDYVSYLTCLSELENRLDEEGRDKLQKAIRGERFKGRKSFLEEIRPYFEDFK